MGEAGQRQQRPGGSTVEATGGVEGPSVCLSGDGQACDMGGTWKTQ